MLIRYAFRNPLRLSATEIPYAYRNPYSRGLYAIDLFKPPGRSEPVIIIIQTRVITNSSGNLNLDSPVLFHPENQATLI
jgi:hypothetical protein